MEGPPPAEPEQTLDQINRYLTRYTEGVWYRPGWEDPAALYVNNGLYCKISLFNTDSNFLWRVDFDDESGRSRSIFSYKKSEQIVYFPLPQDVDLDEDIPFVEPTQAETQHILLGRLTDFFGAINSESLLPNHYLTSEEPNPGKYDNHPFTRAFFGSPPPLYRRYPGYGHAEPGIQGLSSSVKPFEERITEAAERLSEQFSLNPTLSRRLIQDVLRERRLNLLDGKVKRILGGSFPQEAVDFVVEAMA